MSDMSQGPGWWIASDDKWYPPESHPDAVASRAAAAEAKKTAEEKKAVEKKTEEKKTEAAPPGPVGSFPSPSRASTPSVPPPLAGTAPPPGAATRATTRRWGWPWILGLVVILGLAVAALVVALVSGSGPGAPNSIGSSSGVTFHISVPGPAQPGFSGLVGGQDLTGKVIDGTSPGTQALALPVFTYKGRFGGAPYVLHVSLDEAANAGQTQNDQFVFDVIGNYGSKLVAASATFNLTSLSGTSQTVSFRGHVGSQQINGLATATMEGGGGVTITGTANAVPTA